MAYSVNNPGPTYFTVSAVGTEKPDTTVHFYNLKDAERHADERFAGASFQIDEWMRQSGQHVMTHAHLKAGE